MHRLGQLVCRNRKNGLVKFISKKCKNFIGYYENVNWDFRINGESNVLKKLSGQDFSCIFDVGANWGEWSIIAHKMFPDAAINSFEIIQSTAQELRNKMRLRPNIIVNDFGLLDETKDIEVNYYPKKDSTSSIFESKLAPIIHEEGRKIICKVMTGDSYVEDRCIEHIDFLKIDVEGSEEKVLKGFSKMISRGKIDIIQFEYSMRNILSHFLLYDFYSLLVPYGYKIGKIFPDYVDFRDYSFWDENFYMSNFLAVRSDLDHLIRMLS